MARVVGQNVVGGLASVLFSVVRKASAARLGLKICTLIVQVEHLAALTETAASMELTCFTIISNSVIANNTSQQCRGCPTRCSPWGWPCSYAFLIHCHLHLLETHLLIRIHSIPRVRGEDSSGVISIFCCWEHKFLSVSHVKNLATWNTTTPRPSQQQVVINSGTLPLEEESSFNSIDAILRTIRQQREIE
jgi:hypothetical protein